MKIDSALEFRYGERIEYVPHGKGRYSYGLFDIPEPGPMRDVDDKFGGPAMAKKLAVAELVDGSWKWVTMGPGSHRYLSEQAAEFRVFGEWVGFNIVKIPDAETATLEVGLV